MTSRLIQFFVLSLVLVALLAVTADAKNRPPSEQVRKLQSYGFPKIEKHLDVDPTQSFRGSEPVSLGAAAGNSPGEGVGFSYYDAQHNSSQGRNVSNRYDGQIHFAWMFGPTSDVVSNRTVAYNVYDGISGTWPVGAGVGCAVVDVNAVRAGFVNIDSRPPNAGEIGGAAVYAGHSDPSGPSGEGFHVHTWWATTELEFCDWSVNLRVDSALANQYGDPPTWPKLEYLINGTDTVTLALGSSADDPVGAMVLYRTVGQQGGASWTGTVLDSIFFPVHDITASRVSNRVAAAYTWPVGNPTTDDGSGDRTIVYRESTDGGATWGPRVDIAGYTEDGPYVAWLEVSCLITSDDNLHIIWNAGPPGLRNCRLWHWADHTGTISTVQAAEWDPFPDCAMGFNTLNIAKFNISECDGNLYAVWAQANDPINGVTDDCADPNLIGTGLSGNAEVFVSVSSGLDGLAWDAARNLTNTYTPGCDTSLGNECDSDQWPTVSRFGMNNADFTPALDFGNAAQALTVDPDPGGYGGTHYLDVFYTNDLFPSAGVYAGTPDILTRNDLKWFRLPCVDPIVQSNANLRPTRIEYPFYLPHGVDSTIDIIVENTGNATLVGTMEAVQTDVTDPVGWLTIDQAAVNLTAVTNNADTVAMTLNAGGVVNSPGTIVNLEGYVVVRADPPTVRDSVMLTLDFPVADTIVGIDWDTVSTGCVRLAASNNGNLGQSPTSNNQGGANMDYWGTGLDCDDADSIQYDSLPGNAHVYLYDASPVVITSDTVASWAIFGSGLSGENDFKPISNEDLPAPGTFSGDNYEAYWSGQFVTIDSSITLEKTLYAPTSGGDSCNFMIQAVCLYATDGGAISGLTIGEAWDWDVPSDSGVQNIAGSDPINGVVYLQGSEYDLEIDDPDLYECQDNDSRFAGSAFIGYTDASNPTLNTTDPANIYTATNEDFVIPEGGFVPAELYDNMQNNSGISVVAPTTIVDQHMVLTVFKNYSLAAGDTLTFWVAMATVQNGTASDMTNAILAARDWYQNNEADLERRPPSTGCCVGSTGNVNNDAGDVTDVSDLTFLVNHLFVTFQPLPCKAEANINGDAGCTVDVSDLTTLVNHLFVTFQPTAVCDNAACAK